MIIQECIKTEQFVPWYEDMEEYIIIADLKNNVQYLNQAALIKFGYNRQDVRMLQLSSLLMGPKDFVSKTEDKIQLEGRTKEQKLITIEARVACSMWQGKRSVLIMGKEVKEKSWSKDQLITILDSLPYYVWMKDNAPSKLTGKNEILTNQGLLEYLKLFFNKSQEMLLIWDHKHKIIKVNESWKKLGFTEEEITKKGILGLLYSEHKKVVKGKVNNGSIHYEFTNRHQCKGDSLKWISWHIEYIKEHSVFIVQGRDITEKQEEREHAELVKTEVVIEEIKNRFLASISHEFKTPLNIITTAMQLMMSNVQAYNLNKDIANSFSKSIYSVKQNAYRLLRLVNNLIDVTQIDLGQYTLALGLYDVVRIIEDITLTAAPHIEEKGITLTFDTEVEELYMVCDADEIERIVLNLLSNALKYTDHGGRIYVHIKTEDHKIVVSIKDTGIGIEKDKLSSIFDRLRRGESGLVRRAEGSGMGLSLAKALVKLHGGEIEARSKVGYGTEIVFEIPIKEEDSCIEGIQTYQDEEELKVQKCNIEFSDIYYGKK